MSLYSKVISKLKYNFINANRRYISVTYNESVLQRLKNRSLVRVTGFDVIPYLHGLITNDMAHLKGGNSSMYAMFLNTRGRVMYDSIIYTTNDIKTFLVECETAVVDKFQKHLNMFKVKRKIDIDVHPQAVWVLFDGSYLKNINFDEIGGKSEVSKNINNVSLPKYEQVENIHVYKDPRMNLLGARILCDESVSSNDIVAALRLENVKLADDSYQSFRYRLGVAEGTNELPTGNCFPLEANADFLHGVSFTKGCYIGQELTARTHHTGVVRKRIMPLLFEGKVESEIPNETSIFTWDDNVSSIGKVRGIAKDDGLGLLRIDKVLKVPTLNVTNCKALTYRPEWWPAEAPKDKISTAQE